jgi:phosphotriesterase-related protein
MNRRQFNKIAAGVAAGAVLGPLKVQSSPVEGTEIMTVTGPISSNSAGICLSHEHILVDFTGDGERGVQRLRKRKVIKGIIPYMEKIKTMGVRTFFDCTPAYVGRNPKLLKKIAKKTGIHIVSNTGYYGAHSNKFLPVFASTESAEQLAARWIREWERGMQGTRIKPGFIKIGVDMGKLSEMHRKLVRAACYTHAETGLTIAAHTGSAEGAFEELEVLQEEGVAASAFIWVHAQAEKNTDLHVSAASKGAWVSFDNVNSKRIDVYLSLLLNMKRHNLLSNVLISHDGGWYHPGEYSGGIVSRYTDIFTDLVPAMQQAGFSQSEIDQILIRNPARAYAITKRMKG